MLRTKSSLQHESRLESHSPFNRGQYQSWKWGRGRLDEKSIILQGPVLNLMNQKIKNFQFALLSLALAVPTCWGTEDGLSPGYVGTLHLPLFRPEPLHQKLKNLGLFSSASPTTNWAQHRKCEGVCVGAHRGPGGGAALERPSSVRSKKQQLLLIFLLKEVWCWGWVKTKKPNQFNMNHTTSARYWGMASWKLWGSRV